MKELEAEYFYKITVGDWSNDGHGFYSDFIIKTNYSKKDIENAYKKFENKFKISLSRSGRGIVHILHDYQDCYINEEIFNKLKKSGINFNDWYELGEDDEDDSYYFDEQSVCYLYLEMAKVFLKDLTYKILEYETLVKSIGYGCFN